MTKTVRIISANGSIGICRPGIDAATYIITEVPDYVEARNVLSDLAMYPTGVVPTGVMTYRKMQSEISKGFNGFGRGRPAVSIKLSRTARICDLARYPQSYSAMLAAIPPAVVEALPARLLAELVEASWQLAERSKHIVRQEDWQ